MKFGNEEFLSLFPQCVLENIMMTSMLAHISVIVKIKIIMNFMNEILNRPCNSLLATFFESSCGVCPKTVSSSLRRLTCPKWTVNQLSEILRRKRLEKKVPEGVVDTAHLPQCEFSDFHPVPLALLLEFLCWPVNEFYWASYAALAGT